MPTPSSNRDAARCRSCGAPISWALTVNGKRMPLDEVPSADGNLVVKLARNPATGELDLLAIDAMKAGPWAKDEPRRTSHFATCPNAKQHRKEKR